MCILTKSQFLKSPKIYGIMSLEIGAKNKSVLILVHFFILILNILSLDLLQEILNL